MTNIYSDKLRHHVHVEHINITSSYHHIKHTTVIETSTLTSKDAEDIVTTEVLIRNQYCTHLFNSAKQFHSLNVITL
jgi:hypothetical protein